VANFDNKDDIDAIAATSNNDYKEPCMLNAPNESSDFVEKVVESCIDTECLNKGEITSDLENNESVAEVGHIINENCTEQGYLHDVILPVHEDVGLMVDVNLNIISPECLTQQLDRIQSNALSPIEQNNYVDINVDVNDPAIHAKNRITQSTIKLLVNSPCQPAEDFII